MNICSGVLRRVVLNLIFCNIWINDVQVNTDNWWNLQTIWRYMVWKVAVRLWLHPWHPQNTEFTTMQSWELEIQAKLQSGELLLQECGSENDLKVTRRKHLTKNSHRDIRAKMSLSVLTVRETGSFSCRTLVKLDSEILLTILAFLF